MIYRTQFKKQVDNLLVKGYSRLAHLSERKFLDLILPLENKLKILKLRDIDYDHGTLPFVIVIQSRLIASEKMMELVEKTGKKGVTILRPHTAESFMSVEEIPQKPAYLIINIDRGKETLNIKTSDALETIRKDERLPLTIDEGIAIVTHYPEFLRKNNCFSLLASRTGKDKRVPAIWINTKKEPNLGWCWEGNPHTWLGSASCEARI